MSRGCLSKKGRPRLYVGVSEDQSEVLKSAPCAGFCAPEGETGSSVAE